MFRQISKHFEVQVEKNLTVPRFFNPLLSIFWMSDETQFHVFDILHNLTHTHTQKKQFPHGNIDFFSCSHFLFALLFAVSCSLHLLVMLSLW